MLWIFCTKRRAGAIPVDPKIVRDRPRPMTPIRFLVEWKITITATLRRILWLSGLWPDLVLSDWLFPRAMAHYDSQSRAASATAILRPQSQTLVQSSG